MKVVTSAAEVRTLGPVDGVVDIDLTGLDATETSFQRRQEQLVELMAAIVRRLDTVEAEMKGAEERLQWAMNHCLAQIGIEHPELRARAIDIGERLEVLKDYPTPPNCTSPFAPTWINEMVRRAQKVE